MNISRSLLSVEYVVELNCSCSEVKQGFLSYSEEEEKKKKRKRWKSIYVMYFTMFLTALSECACLVGFCSLQSDIVGYSLTLWTHVSVDRD